MKSDAISSDAADERIARAESRYATLQPGSLRGLAKDDNRFPLIVECIALGQDQYQPLVEAARRYRDAEKKFWAASKKRMFDHKEREAMRQALVDIVEAVAALEVTSLVDESGYDGLIDEALSHGVRVSDTAPENKS